MRKYKPKCKATGKAKFQTEILADKAKIRIWSHDPSADILDLHSYVCEHCGNWHVGHKSYYKKKLEQERANELDT